MAHTGKPVPCFSLSFLAVADKDHNEHNEGEGNKQRYKKNKYRAGHKQTLIIFRVPFSS